MMGAARKHDKARGKDKDVKNAQPALDLPRIYGCPVPDPVQCSIGKPILPGEDGVTMECSNEKCPFASQLLHQLCFESFEDHLVKVLSNLGSARGWTDAQRRANLWDKKGQSLIAKVCRCRCGLGMTRMDEIAAYDRQKRRTQDEQMTRARAGTVITDFIATGTKKKCKSKATLPKLNFGLVKVSPQAQVEERELRNAV
uniref:Headcase domain-containing protein n=1 Tax=Heterorhabditis bacteriophora TaxID=37862 RepID=A0A1I7XU63_HETBA